MNDLITVLSQETGLARTQVRSVIDGLGATVGSSLKAGDEVRISGFGVFVAKRNEAREGRNPRTGEKIKIAASKTVRFRPSAELKNALK
jgi:DNA-binding protein HU-beta